MPGLIELYVTHANSQITTHFAKGTLSKISRAEIELQILSEIDKASFPVDMKICWYHAILHLETFTSFWIGVKTLHSLPEACIARYAADHSLLSYEVSASVQEEIEDGLEFSGEAGSESVGEAAGAGGIAGNGKERAVENEDEDEDGDGDGDGDESMEDPLDEMVLGVGRTYPLSASAIARSAKKNNKNDDTDDDDEDDEFAAEQERLAAEKKESARVKRNAREARRRKERKDAAAAAKAAGGAGAVKAEAVKAATGGVEVGPSVEKMLGEEGGVVKGEERAAGDGTGDGDGAGAGIGGVAMGPIG